MTCYYINLVCELQIIIVICLIHYYYFQKQSPEVRHVDLEIL